MKTRLVLLISAMVLVQAAGGVARATEWETLNSNGRVELVGKTKAGNATHTLAFSCEAMPGTWRPAQWNGYKVLRMAASFDQTPTVPTPKSDLIPSISSPGTSWPGFGLPNVNSDATVTIITSRGSLTIEPDEFMQSDVRVNKDPRALALASGLFGYTSAQILVSPRLLEILRRDSTLHIRFGDPNSDAFGFTADLAPGKRQIIDFVESCR
jgi:hypothetical protein